MKHVRQLGNRIAVRILPDEDRYTGRECPNPDCKSYFKVVSGTGLQGEDLPCHCPYCGHTAKHDEFWTEDQIEYGKSVAIRKFTDAFRKDLKAFEFNQRPRGPFGIGISMKFKPGRSTPIHHYREKKLQTDLVCANCTLRYSVYGVCAYCPDCGEHNSLQIFKSNMEIVRKVLNLAKDTERDLSASLIESALEDCVSAFDGFGRELCRVYAPHALIPGKVGGIRFQNLDYAREKVQVAFGIDITESWRAEIEGVGRLFQKRHLIAHKLGVVDQEYVNRTGDHSVPVRHKIVVGAYEVEQLTDILKLAAESIYAQFKGLDSKSENEYGNFA